MFRRLLALLLCATTARAQPALDSLVPPSPAPNGFIADRGPVLDAASLARLDARIAAVQRRTGGDVGVAILRDLHDRAPSDVALAIYRAWKIGHVDAIGASRRDLGALLLVVPKELAASHRGECFVLTGRGAEATLIDARAADICRDSVIPHLKARAYEAAIAGGVDGIGAAFDRAAAGAPVSQAPDAARMHDVAERRHSRGGVVALVLVVLAAGAGGVVMFVMWLRRRRRNKPRLCPRGHGKMVRLAEDEDDAALTRGQQLEERLGSVDYDVWACPQCDERIVIAYRRGSSFEACPQCSYRTVRRTSQVLREATESSEGLERTTLSCENCGWEHVTHRTIPRVVPPPPPGFTSGGSSGGGDGGSSSFGGSGASSGGGGGASY